MDLLNVMSQRSSLNNKHIGIINSRQLINFNIQIPTIQRIRDDTKVREIVEYQQKKLKEDGVCNFLGVINIHYCEENKNMYLIDGQHRYEAVKIINENINIPVIIELVIVKTMSQLKENYKILNMNTPLPEFPETIDKSIPENVAMFFKERYPAIWSKNSRARRPHIYFNYFQEALGVLTDVLGIQSAVELQSIIENYNVKFSNWKTETEKEKENDNILTKCREIGFYYGRFPHISDDYCYEWVRDIIYTETGITLKKNKESASSKKKAIPKKVKDDAWKKYIGNKSEVLCICCRTDTITPFDFHAGHIVSEANGGEVTVENIRPICAACNLSMGQRNMDEFIAKHYPVNKSKFDAVCYDEPNKKTFLSSLFS